MDIGLNEHFDFELDDRNDAPTVEGRVEFEQKLRLRVTDYFHEIIGNAEGQNALKLVQVAARRVARDEQGIETVSAINAEYAEDAPNTIEVTVVYDTNDDFTFSLSE